MESPETPALIDLVGNPLFVGDKVAFDVLSYKQSTLRVGKITDISTTGRGDAFIVSVSYEIAPKQWRKNAKPTKKTIHKLSSGVVKVHSDDAY